MVLKRVTGRCRVRPACYVVLQALSENAVNPVSKINTGIGFLLSRATSDVRTFFFEKKIFFFEKFLRISKLGTLPTRLASEASKADCIRYRPKGLAKHEQDVKTYPSLRKLGLTHTILRSHVHASFNRAPSFTVDFPTGLQLGDSFETEPLCVDADANIACLRAINTKGNDVCLKI